MSISERCASGCGASIDFAPGVDINVALEAATKWRIEHQHFSGPHTPEKPPMGFNTMNVVGTDYFDGEDAQPVGDMTTGPDYED